MKKTLQKEIDNIEVPKEVKIALIKGSHKAPKRKKGWKFITLGISAIAIIAILIAAMPQLSGPWLEKIDKIDSTIGGKLKIEGKITPQNISVEDKGITINITGSYFDGGQIGVLYTIKGLPQDITNPEMLAKINIPGEKWQFTNELGRGTPSLLKKDSNTYEGEWTMAYPGEINGKEFTLPLEFSKIMSTGDALNQIDGKWSFNIPIGKIQSNVIDVNSQKNMDNLSVGIGRVIKGEYITSIDVSERNILGAFLHSKNLSSGEGIGATFVSSGFEINRESISGKEKTIYRNLIENNPNYTSDKLLSSIEVVESGSLQSSPIKDFPVKIQSEKGSNEYFKIGDAYIKISTPNFRTTIEDLEVPLI